MTPLSSDLNGRWARLLGRLKTVQALEQHAYDFGYDVARNDIGSGWCPGCCNCSPATTEDPLCNGDGLLRPVEPDLAESLRCYRLALAHRKGAE